MIELRPFASLGGANHGWLDARHHFSFASYHDPRRVQWGSLRVLNDDLIAPHRGFDPHGHRDMEIITYVRTGAVSHEDSMGNKGRTEAGDVQVMSAGSGVVHSEYNHEDMPTTLFQIWIVPDAPGGKPGWGARQFPKADRAGQFVTLASGVAGDDEALPIRADARVAGATIRAGHTAVYETRPGRHVYLVPATGRIRIDTVEAAARDGVAIADMERIIVTALEDADVVLVDSK